jgi:hypothetical protein
MDTRAPYRMSLILHDLLIGFGIGLEVSQDEILSVQWSPNCLKWMVPTGIHASRRDVYSLEQVDSVSAPRNAN